MRQESASAQLAYQAGLHEPEVQSLFGNILAGCFILLVILMMLGMTELASRAVGPFDAGMYSLFFITLILAAALSAIKIPERREDGRGRRPPDVKTPAFLQEGYRRLSAWSDCSRHPIGGLFWAVMSIWAFQEAAFAITARFLGDGSAPFLEILSFALIMFAMGVGALVLLSLLAGLLPDSPGENDRGGSELTA